MTFPHLANHRVDGRQVDDELKAPARLEVPDDHSFAQVQARITSGTQDVVYFTNALHVLLQDIAKDAA